MQGKGANSLRDDSTNPRFCLEYIIFTRRKTGVGLSKECSFIKIKLVDIASMLLVSLWTLQQRVRQMGLQDAIGFSKIADDELDSIVRSNKEVHGASSGRSMVMEN